MTKRKCDECGAVMNECYRFTDWDYDQNDSYGTFDECKKVFDKAVEENETGRYSIYDVSECPKCETFFDEGVEFNTKCPDYNLGGE